MPNKEEFNLNVLFNSLSFTDVIDGLNKYFAEDETRVRVPRLYVEIESSKVSYYRFDAEMYLDKLISWLRTKHGIFYYPGMEAKYAKTERIPPLTERLMDEGALNSLKKLHKRVTGMEPEVDSHTLIADGISHAVSVKETQIEELKTHIDLLRDDLWNSDKKDLMDYIRQEASRNGFELPEENDDIFTVKRVFHDLLELLRKRDTKHRKDLCDILEALGISKSHTVYLDVSRLKEKAIQRASVIKSEHDRYLEQLDKTTADYQALIDSSTELRQKCDFLEDELGKEAVIREFLDRRRTTRTKLDTIEKKLEELLNDVKDVSAH